MSSFGNKILLAIAPRFAAWVMSLLHALMKTDVVDEENIRQFWNKNEHVIISSWHDQLFMMVKVESLFTIVHTNEELRSLVAPRYTEA